jgi:predicted phage terminase large subunit-like protein
VVDEAPAGIDWIRVWDLASTEVKPGTDPDWTAGAKIGLHEGKWYLADMRRLRATPLEVERLIAQTAATDGKAVDIYMEREPGASGVNTIDNYERNVLAGYTFREHKPEGKKWERAKPMSSAAEAGNFVLVAGRWNVPFLDEAELFPLPGAHDDQIDTCSAGMAELAGSRFRIIV